MLTRVEVAILEILEHYRGRDILERELRGLLQKRGFRRSAPAFVFTMMSLQDKRLVKCQEEVRLVEGREIKERFYSPSP
jgi:hypothetical protein